MVWVAGLGCAQSGTGGTGACAFGSTGCGAGACPHCTHAGAGGAAGAGAAEAGAHGFGGPGGACAFGPTGCAAVEPGCADGCWAPHFPQNLEKHGERHFLTLSRGGGRREQLTAKTLTAKTFQCFLYLLT